MDKTTKTDGRRWTHRVFKRMHGGDGEYFDFRTAATFPDEQSACQYAEKFAREQGAARVYGARIVVCRRQGNEIRAVYRSDDFIAPVRS